MAQMTITEALAEIKTVSKRLTTKKEFIKPYLARSDGIRDPMEKDGGSAKAVAEGLQSIKDLEQRVVDLRRGIQTANEQTLVTIEGVERSIADWLVWRRDVAPDAERFLRSLHGSLTQMRDQARQKGMNVYGISNVQVQAEKPTDLIVNVDEKKLVQDIEQMDNIKGQLDGILSLKNATVMIAI